MKNLRFLIDFLPHQKRYGSEYFIKYTNILPNNFQIGKIQSLKRVEDRMGLIHSKRVTTSSTSTPGSTKCVSNCYKIEVRRECLNYPSRKDCVDQYFFTCFYSIDSPSCSTYFQNAISFCVNSGAGSNDCNYAFQSFCSICSKNQLTNNFSVYCPTIC